MRRYAAVSSYPVATLAELACGNIGEAVSDLVNWTHQSVPGLIKAGVLPDHLASALRLLRDQALAAAIRHPRRVRDSCAPP
jgi:hypothetical protein